MTCPACGAPASPDSRFCAKCGAPVPQPVAAARAAPSNGAGSAPTAAATPTAPTNGARSTPMDAAAAASIGTPSVAPVGPPAAPEPPTHAATAAPSHRQIRPRRLSLGTRFTLLLVLVFVGGMVLGGFGLFQALEQRAQDEVAAQA